MSDIFGALVGGAMDMIGASQKNLYAKKQADKANTWNAAQAQKQMDFQERMSGTAYQRAIKDMQAAGLNPMLAYSQGGSSTPSGAMSAATVPQLESPIAKGLSGAQQGLGLVQASQQIAQSEAQTDNLKAAANKARSETMEHSANSAKLWSEIYNLHQSENLSGARADNARLEGVNIRAALDGILANSARQGAEFRAMKEGGGFAADVETRKAEAKRRGYEAEHSGLDLTRARADEKFYDKVNALPSAIRMLLQLMQAGSSARSALGR